jgi:TolA-binding protein
MRFFKIVIFLSLSLNVCLASNAIEIDLEDGSSLEERVSSLQSKLRITNNQNKNLHAKILELEEKIREMNGKLLDLESIDSKFTNKIQNLTADTNHRLENLEKKSPSHKPQDKVIAGPMTQYSNMIEKKNYKGAIQGLEQYISTHTTSTTLGEAYYWLGYAYMSNQEYTKAVKMFVNSYNGYPNSIKAEYSLLNMSISLARMQERNKSCAILNKLINTSQSKQILDLAKYQHKDFKCPLNEVKPVRKTPGFPKAKSN